MMIIKAVLLFIVFLFSSYVGKIISGQYKIRVEELKEMKKSFIAIETKMKYTYDVLPEIFKEVAIGLRQSIREIFEYATLLMKEKTANEAWIESIQSAKTNMTKEDLEILKGYGKLLGKTDIDGQVSQIKLTNEFLETQIEKAEKELVKNEKLYKTLGTVCGLAIVILLI